MITALKKWGNSHGIRIPSVFLKSLGWAKGEALSIEMLGETGVLITKVQREKQACRDCPLYQKYCEGVKNGLLK